MSISRAIISEEVALSTGIFNVNDYGAVGDGVTDDTSAIQSAVTAASVLGGTVLFRSSSSYVVTATIVVTSLYPVHLVGSMTGFPNVADSDRPSIIIGGVIAGSVFQYLSPQAPGYASLTSGGGRVFGLMFIDPTGSGGTPGTRTVNEALGLDDFALSTVEECVFQWIAGSAIRVVFGVMSSIKSCRIRYCGAASRPAINLVGVSGRQVQSFLIFDTRLEVCHGAPYIQASQFSPSIKILSCGFEADHSATPASNEIYIDTNGTDGIIQGNHFGRLDESNIVLGTTAYGTIVSGNTFVQGASVNSTFSGIIVTGSQISITGNSFRSNRAQREIEVNGAYCVVSDNKFNDSGHIYINNVSTVVSGNQMYQSSSGYTTDGAWITLSSSAGGSKVIGNILDDTGGAIDTMGGIKWDGNGTSIVGNTVRGFNGNVYAYDAAGGSYLFDGNTEINGTGTYSFRTASWSNCNIGTNRLHTDGNPLRGSATFDPTSLADGVGETTTVTVTGALLGDPAWASFSLNTSGITITAWVSASNTVSVRFQNESGGLLDIASGTLYAGVSKR